MTDKAANKEDKDFLYLCFNSSSLMDLNRDFRFGFPTQRFKGVLSEGSSHNCLYLAGAQIVAPRPIWGRTVEAQHRLSFSSRFASFQFSPYSPA